MRAALVPLLFGIGAFGLSAAAVAKILGADIRYVGFEEPQWFAAVALPLVALLVRAFIANRPATLLFSRTQTLRRIGGGLLARLADLPDGLRFAAALWLVVAMARPTSSRLSDHISQKGIDIAIALDMSGSMRESDMSPNRLEVAKAVIDAFIERRRHDRVALVAFGSEATTVAPLTLDHDILRALLGRMSIGVIDGNSTAIGAGLGLALNRLAESDAESKVIVLLTDGVQSADGVDPDAVAQEAAERGVIVYTVLMGRQDAEQIGAKAVDPAQLERIASATGGFAYTAEDRETLETSFLDLLDKLKRSEIESTEIRAELFFWALWPAFLLLLLDIVLRNGRLRRFP